jgi:hypothetical protein
MINDFKIKSLEMDIFKNQNQINISTFKFSCIMMLDHNLLACKSPDNSVDIVEL